MPNKVDTVFSGDARDLFRVIELGEKRIEEFNRKINSFGINPTFGNPPPLSAPTYKPIDPESTKGLKEAAELQIKIAQQEKAVEAAKQATLKTERELLAVERERNRLASSEVSLKAKTDKLAAADQRKSSSGKTNDDDAFVRQFDTQSKTVQAEQKRFLQERLLRERVIQQEIEKGEKALTRIKIAEAKSQNNAAINELKNRERAERQAQSAGSNGGGRGNNFRDVGNSLGFNNLTGFGVAGTVGAGIYGIKQFVDLTETAIEKSVASSRANRLLASSATEAGKAYGELSEANKKYAELLGLSDVATARTTAKIQQLATFSGKPQDAAKLRTGFADLSAAKGIDSKDLETLIGTILSGQDEGLNRLGISDPGQLYKAYAASIGVASDKLTQHQKVQAAVNAVMDKSAIFKGTAEAKMGSLEGQTARASAQFENFTTSLSNSFTQSYTFNSILTETIKLTKQLTYDTDELNKKRSQGTLTQKDISDAAAPGFLSREGGSILRGFDRFMSGFAKLPKYLTYGAVDPFAESSRKFAEAAANQDPELQQQYREDFLRIQINNQIRLEALQKKAAADQQKALDETIAKEEKRQQIIEKQADFLNSFKDPRATTSDIQNKLQSLKNGSVFGEGELSEAETKKLIDAGEQEISQRTAQTYQRILQSEKSNLNELRVQLSNIANDPKLFFEQRESLTATFKEKIKEVSQSFIRLKDDYASSLGSIKSGENPFVQNFLDIGTAVERAREKYKQFTELFGSTKFADKISAAEIEAKTKANSLKDFDNRFDALKIRQEARRLEATPERQFADFKRALETVERKTDALARIYSLDKQISEADFYARRFNPNNPKSFDESRFSFAERDRFADLAGERKRGESLDDFEKRRKEAIDTGIKIFDAIADVNKFKSFSLEGTGILGEGIIADKILEAIPKREDLLKQLESPYAQTRESAFALLSEQSKALTVKRAMERKKLDDFLEDQKTAEFGKKFAYEQIDLINNNQKLTDAEKAQKRFSVAEALGNDLDPRLKSLKIQDAYKVAEQRENQDAKGRKIAEDTKDLVDAIFSALTKTGIKIDPKTLPASNVNVEVKDSPTSQSSVTRATPDDTAQGMDLSSYIQLNFMQRPKKKK